MTNVVHTELSFKAFFGNAKWTVHHTRIVHQHVHLLVAALDRFSELANRQKGRKIQLNKTA